MYSKRFEKETFKNDVKENVRTLYRKEIEEATPQQIFQAVSYAVKEAIVDDWLATQKTYEKRRSKDRILYVNGISYGTCTWQQPDQHDCI